MSYDKWKVVLERGEETCLTEHIAWCCKGGVEFACVWSLRLLPLHFCLCGWVALFPLYLPFQWWAIFSAAPLPPNLCWEPTLYNVISEKALRTRTLLRTKLKCIFSLLFYFDCSLWASFRAQKCVWLLVLGVKNVTFYKYWKFDLGKTWERRIPSYFLFKKIASGTK